MQRIGAVRRVRLDEGEERQAVAEAVARPPPPPFLYLLLSPPCALAALPRRRDRGDETAGRDAETPALPGADARRGPAPEPPAPPRSPPAPPAGPSIDSRDHIRLRRRWTGAVDSHHKRGSNPFGPSFTLADLPRSLGPGASHGSTGEDGRAPATPFPRDGRPGAQGPWPGGRDVAQWSTGRPRATRARHRLWTMCKPL